MSNKKDHTSQPQERLPTDDAFRRPRYVPYPPLMDLYTDERDLFRAAPGVTAQTTNLERARPDIHTFPFGRVPTREELSNIGPSANTASSYARVHTPGYSYSPRQTLPPLSPAIVPSQPLPTAAAFPARPSTGRSAHARPSGDPPPYWQHIGEPRMICTPPREMDSLAGTGLHRTMVPLPSVRDIFAPADSETERVALPPLYMSPSVYCHMRDADPASAVDAGVGPRFRSRSRSRSRSPDRGRSRGPETDPKPERQRTNEKDYSTATTPTPSRPAHATRERQIAPAPVAPQIQVPGPSAVLTEFHTVDAHTAKCDLCNKRNVQGMTRCVECGWQTCNACTIKNNYFRSHRAGPVLHVGPVDKQKMPTAASIKKGKQAAQRKRDDPDYVPESEKGSKKKRTTKYQVRMTGSTSKPSSSSSSSSSSSPDGSPNEADFVDLSNDKAAMRAARNLFAMSVEAFEMEARARTSKFRKRWQYPLRVEDNDNNRDGDDETEPVGTEEDESENAGSSSPLARCIPRLRREALEIAREEGEFYLRGRRIRHTHVSATHLVEEGESESAKSNKRVNTRAQTYARKRSGHGSRHLT